MNKASLSIIVPMYNSEKYIENTIKSILELDINDIEILLIDNNSNDNTIEICNKIVQSNDTIDIKIYKENRKGVSYARNRGLIESNGRYVMFVDSDDYIIKEGLENLYYQVSFNNCDIGIGKYDNVDSQRKTIETYDELFNLGYGIEKGRDILYDFFYENIWVWTGSAIYRKEFLEREKILFNTGLQYCEDTNFIVDALYKADSVYKLPEVISLYVHRKESVSNIQNLNRLSAIQGYKLINEKIDDYKLKKVLNEYFIPKKIADVYLGLITKDTNIKSVLRKYKDDNIDILLNTFKFRNVTDKITIKVYLLRKIPSIILGLKKILIR